MREASAVALHGKGRRITGGRNQCLQRPAGGPGWIVVKHDCRSRLGAEGDGERGERQRESPAGGLRVGLLVGPVGEERRLPPLRWDRGEGGSLLGREVRGD